MSICYLSSKGDDANGDLAEAFGEIEALYHAMTMIVPVANRKPRRAVTVDLKYRADGSLASILTMPTGEG